MERQQFESLRAIALETMPGDQIRHSSWPKGKTLTCSTEFLHSFGNYPFANRGIENPSLLKLGGRGGYWEHAGSYPPRVNTVSREVRHLSVPHHVPVVKHKAA